MFRISHWHWCLEITRPKRMTKFSEKYLSLRLFYWSYRPTICIFANSGFIRRNLSGFCKLVRHTYLKEPLLMNSLIIVLKNNKKNFVHRLHNKSQPRKNFFCMFLNLPKCADIYVFTLYKMILDIGVPASGSVNADFK